MREKEEREMEDIEIEIEGVRKIDMKGYEDDI